LARLIHALELRLEISLQPLDRLYCVLVPDDGRWLDARLLRKLSEAVSLIDGDPAARTISTRNPQAMNQVSTFGR
jgi:hypothetical protein